MRTENCHSRACLLFTVSREIVSKDTVVYEEPLEADVSFLVRERSLPEFVEGRLSRDPDSSRLSRDPDSSLPEKIAGPILPLSENIREKETSRGPLPEQILDPGRVVP